MKSCARSRTLRACGTSAVRAHPVTGGTNGVDDCWTAIGLVALLCDHIQTLPEEVRLVWMAPASLAKFLFLANRYLVAGSIIAATHCA